jgi:hypothetical protein
MATLSPNKIKKETELGEIWRLVFEKTGGFRQKLGSCRNLAMFHPPPKKKD